MRKIRELGIILILIGLAAGCAPAATRTPTGTAQPEQIPAAQEAQEDLANRLGVNPEAIELVKVEDEDWPDACLGLPQEGEACALVITPGFRVTLEAEGKQYIYRTDETGEAVRLEQIEE